MTSRPAVCVLVLASLWGCRGGESTARSVRLRAVIHAELPELEVTLVGEDAGESGERMNVQRLVIRRAGEAEPLQVIEPLHTETPATEGAEGLAVVDMNFDGYADLRLVEFVTAGPNVPHLNWLYVPESGVFERSPELDRLSAPVFDPASRRITSRWRDGATRYGTDTYEMVGDRPRLLRREVKEHSDARTYRLTISERVDGEMRVVDERLEGR